MLESAIEDQQVLYIAITQVRSCTNCFAMEKAFALWLTAFAGK
jgi:hypothetical protein